MASQVGRIKNLAIIIYYVIIAIMITRLSQPTIIQQLHHSPAVALLGPRQVGKTTLAREIAKHWPEETIYIDLERPSDLARISEPEMFFKKPGRLTIIDEIQRVPTLFPVLRAVIDERRFAGEKTGQFLLLGSASLDIVQGVSESLAGRISYVDLGIVNAMEYSANKDHSALWLRGGFPESLLAASDQDSFIWRENFITSYLERDIPNLGPRIPAQTLRRFWMMLAHLQGQIIDKASIAASIGVSPPTIARYIDLLVDLFLIRPLQPWSGNIGKRLVKRPKYFIRDSGLVHALLNITTFDELLGHPIAGKSWEGFVIENLLSVSSKRAIPFFYESSSNAEIDLIFELPSHRIAIEVKRSLTPTLSKGFYNACEALDVKQTYIVYPGQERFTFAKNIEVLPVEEMMAIIKNV